MSRASVYAARFPVQPSPGNHEGAANFSEYQVRHAGVAAHSNTGTSLYYSFDNGLVHYLVFNSETYIDGGIANMLNFMRADLAAVDRARTPWVVAYSHKFVKRAQRCSAAAPAASATATLTTPKLQPDRATTTLNQQ